MPLRSHVRGIVNAIPGATTMKSPYVYTFAYTCLVMGSRYIVPVHDENSSAGPEEIPPSYGREASPRYFGASCPGHVETTAICVSPRLGRFFIFFITQSFAYSTVSSMSPSTFECHTGKYTAIFGLVVSENIFQIGRVPPHPRNIISGFQER